MEAPEVSYSNGNANGSAHALKPLSNSNVAPESSFKSAELQCVPPVHTNGETHPEVIQNGVHNGDDREEMLLGPEVQRLLRRHLFILGAALILVVIGEVIVLCQPRVPWLLDKPFFILALFFQACMGVFFPLRSCGCVEFAGRLMDWCHWAFVVMIFSSVFILRSIWALVFVAGLFGLSVGFRISMRNTCIISAVARRSSMPNINDSRVNCMFIGFFAIATARVIIQFFVGDP
eukprot:gnl/MRDRNA2_/MRDRNA2_18775_c0_seq1.p1 gnl/MRDRNA2_/MRDRNA2_18775_c0~~gnl/MRDRNA2_/MRDRNA2_18775_c0_seq1.p1  ORF type:complete len:233 (-),score=25.72 gnl/MRDRNA2_/MRDRNA2_18775_c0_seq1:55-753(-)